MSLAGPGPVLTVLTLAVLATVVLRNGAYWWRMWRAPARLSREREEIRRLAAAVEEPDLEIVFVVPAYKELEALPHTFHSLRTAIEASRYRSGIVVVTSVHEDPDPVTGLTTRDVAEGLCADVDGAVCVVDTTAVPSMAAAFNTGLGAVAATRADRAGVTYVVAYNADSTAVVDSVRAIGDTLLARDLPRVAQVNFLSMRSLARTTGPGRWFAVGAAYYQSRWALGFELDLHRRNSAARRRVPWGHSYHLKGHGAVLRLDTAVEMGGFSTQTPCEDLELGFRLSLRDVPVHVVPVLEDTEHPETAGAVIAQKRYWFSGMIDVLQFHRLLAEERRAAPVRFELVRLGSLYRSAGCFLLGPLPYWYLFVAAVVLGQPLLAVPPVLNAVLSAWLIRRAAHAVGSPLAPLVRFEAVLLPLGILTWSLARNIGPVQYLGTLLRGDDRQARLRAVHQQHLQETPAVAEPV